MFLFNFITSFKIQLMCFIFKKNNKLAKKPVNRFLQDGTSASIRSLQTSSVRSKFSLGGGGGGEVGVTVKDARSGVVRVGVIKESFQKHLKIGWVKAKVEPLYFSDEKSTTVEQ